MGCFMFLISRVLKKYYVFIFVGFLAAVCMMTALSHVIWDSVPLLIYLQFTWRFLGVAGFFLCLCLASIGFIPSRYWRWGVVGLLGCLLLIPSIDAKYLKAFSVSWVEEPGALSRLNANAELFRPVNSSELDVPSPRLFDFPAGEAVVQSEKKVSPINYKYTVVAATPSLACFYQYDFLGWRVLVDGHDVKRINNKYGLILFSVPPGTHDVHIYFGASRAHVIGNTITVLTLLGIILWLILCFVKRYRKRRS